MSSLTVPLALGCVLHFGHLDPAMTREQGGVNDGMVYRTVTAVDRHGRHQTIETGGHGKGFSPGSLFKAGASPDGHYFAYLAINTGAQNIQTEMCFVSAATCASEEFLKATDGSALETIDYEGWDSKSPHTVRLSRLQGGYESGIAAEEFLVKK